MKFLVCALFYGDFPALAARCADTLARLRGTGRIDLRIGFNEVSPACAALVRAALPGVEILAATPQLYKYPMMRRLIHGYAGDATHLMWFDDDSCLLPDVDAAAWLAMVEAAVAPVQGTLGSRYGFRLTEMQSAWVRAQPWFAGRALPEVTWFTTGGWLVAPLALLRRFDWPATALLHNGGDLALGALLHQHGLEPLHFREGVAINADASLRESSAPRRGYSEHPVDS
ncbi:MAG: hypothetical protein ABI919_01895 [Ramlibacter sp.]